LITEERSGLFKMSSFKTAVSVDEAKDYLKNIAGSEISNVVPIDMGELSRVFSFSKGNKEFILHLRTDRDSLDKAKYMYDQYSGYSIPIPKVVSIGNAGQLYYSITEKAPGRPISTFQPEEVELILDELAKEFTNVNNINIDKSKGYGWFSPSGTAAFNTWTECLEDFFNIESSFYGDWTRLYEESFLERDIFENLYARMLDLTKYSPEEPYLVHGDFHLGNMLSDGSKITGIVDWEMAMYGDFMLDLGVMHFWAPDLRFPQRVKEAWEEKGRIIEHFEERLLCYQIFKGIDGLRFFAKKNEKPSYEYVKGKLEALV
jgi:hygromycin-B 4-O-kinase